MTVHKLSENLQTVGGREYYRVGDQRVGKSFIFSMTAVSLSEDGLEETDVLDIEGDATAVLEFFERGRVFVRMLADGLVKEGNLDANWVKDHGLDSIKFDNDEPSKSSKMLDELEELYSHLHSESVDHCYVDRFNEFVFDNFSELLRLARQGAK